jgi:TonB-linked SusC/RagA family outer membrane protein
MQHSFPFAKLFTRCMGAFPIIMLIALSQPGPAFAGNGPEPAFSGFRAIRGGLQQIPVKGVVKNSAGETLAGVTIRVKGTVQYAISDEHGNFSIEVASLPVTLEFSFIGYEKKEQLIERQGAVKVVLKDKIAGMNELVVIGYGKVKKKDLTGSIVNVNMKNIEHEPVTSVDLALQGRVPGADIMATTGEPGATTTIRIRGTRSITATNEPLIVVDGVIDGVSSLNDINTSDIASISVLKDASATAIYGSRGSNGVIIITTKHGQKGKPSITFRNTFGVSQLPRELDVMDASQFAQYRNDYAYFATSDNYGSIDGTTPQSKYPYPNPLAMGKGTDWQKEITRIAPYHSHFLSMSGGGDKSDYYASVGYDDNQGIIQKSGLQRITGRLNFDYQLFKWMKVGYKYNFANEDQDQNLVTIGGASWWSGAIFLNPLIKPKSNFNDLWYSGQKFNSPRAILDDGVIRNLKKNNATNTVYVEIEPVENLKINSQLNYYSYARHTFQFDPGDLPAKEEGEGARAYRGEYTSHNLMSQTTLNYAHDWQSRHHIDLTLGFIGQKTGGDNFTLEGTGYQSDFIKWNNMNSIPDKENYDAGSSNTSKTSMSYLARLNYNFRNKYYLTVTGRRDGSSNFAENRKWAFFPSAALKWTVSNENFMKSVNWINEFSVRASAGRTGNDGISSYNSLSALGSTTNGYLFDGSQPVAFYPSRLASENLTWEKTDMYNLATDISLFHSRVNITLEGYLSYTSDLLLNVQVPRHTGYTTRLANVGKTSNKGLEFSIETRNISKAHFSWTSTFSIAHNKQMVNDIATVDYVSVYSGNSNNSYMMYGYEAGYPLNALWGFQYGGTWKSQQEIDRNKITKAYVSGAPSLYTAGAPRYYDIDHNGILNENDLIYLGNADPYVYGGLQNSFTVGNFDFSVFVNYSLGGKIYNISEQWMAGGNFTNQYAFMLKAWHPVRNPTSNIPRPGAVDNIASDRMVYDASYVRLKTLSVGYTWDLGRLTNHVLRDAQFSLSGENLLLWKRYNGFDPDVSSEGTSSTLRRADVGAYPKPRTFVASIQIRY